MNPSLGLSNDEALFLSYQKVPKEKIVLYLTDLGI